MKAIHNAGATAETFWLAVINEVKEQFESNSQPPRVVRPGESAVINEVKEQFESNSQHEVGEVAVESGCDQRS